MASSAAFTSSPHYNPTHSIATALPPRSNSAGSRYGFTARSASLDVLDTNTTGPGSQLNLQTTRLTLRKKPQSISTCTSACTSEPPVHMRRLSGIPKTLSFPTFHPTTEPDDSRPVSAHSAHPPSTSKLHPRLLPPNRSPSQKRKPPASHSSYGIDSTLGPPPSYSTQRTLSQDRIRTQKPPERITPQLNEVAVTATHHSRNLPGNDQLTALPTPRTSDPDFSSPDTLDSHTQEGSDTTPPTSAGGANMSEVGEVANKGLGLDGAQDDPKASSSDETQKSEDLFLNIAKTDASRIPSSRIDKRRSRISLPFLSGSRPSTAAARSSAMSSQFDSSHLAPDSERPFGKRSSLGQHVSGALTSSTYFDDTRSHLGRPSDHRSTVGSVDDRSQLRSRRHSNANVDTLRPPTRSRTSRMVSENLYADRLRTGEQVATESTISTTAPSTVWDELDDLKSRIRKLELTGKLPPSSAAAMTSTERPRTATTAATTLSSSPKHNKPAAAPLASAIEGVSSTVHPLLHEALTNAKASLPQDVYQKLQATAQDALQLSSMLSQEGYGSNGSALTPQTERQIRRRTESMCRGLTELAIAMLADNRGVSSPIARPGSREQHIGSATSLPTRSYSNDTPAERPPVASRVQSRLENRRTSLLLGQTQSTQNTPEGARSSIASTFRTPPASVASQPVPTSRISRTSTATRNRRAQNHSFLDGATDNEDEPSPSVAIRPVSRAMTEVGSGSNYRSLARDRAMFSREYTKQHPLPTPQGSVPPPVDPATLAARMPMPSNLVTNASRIVSRRTYPVISPANEIVSPNHIENSSPNTTPSHVARPPFTISIERRNPHLPVQIPDSVSNSPLTAMPATPSEHSMGTNVTGSGIGSDRRPSSTRRSLGFASRISNVSSRLKAARAERIASSSHAPGLGQQANMAAVRSPVVGVGKEDVDVESLMVEEEGVIVKGGNGNS